MFCSRRSTRKTWWLNSRNMSPLWVISWMRTWRTMTSRTLVGPFDRRDASHGDNPPGASRILERTIRSWPSPQAREWTRRMVEALCIDPSILAMVALGSAVRPVGAAQDIDLLVVYRGAPPHFGSLPLDVDLRAYAADGLVDKIAAGQDLLGWALHYGVLICEQEGYWSQLSNVWTDRIPLPSAEQADERAARAKRLTNELRGVGDIEAAAEQYVSYLTHDARARLIRAGVYPASRPELPCQLRSIGEGAAAAVFDAALAERTRNLVV